MNVERGRGAALASLLRGGQTVRVTAFGGSMAPAIRSGDRLTIDPAALGAIDVGDVVLYRLDRQLVVHRAIALEPLLLQGDALAEPDSAAGEREILGRVVEVEPRGRRVRSCAMQVVRWAVRGRARRYTNW